MIRSQISFFTLATFLALTGIHSVFADDNGTNRFFKNPVVARGQDPWVIRWQTNYFLCQSRPDDDVGSVWVNRATRLEDIGVDNWKRVWHAPKGTNYSKQVWAPELHFIQGKWYIYVAGQQRKSPHVCTRRQFRRPAGTV
jgi:GH43 family beta-xylosidase